MECCRAPASSLIVTISYSVLLLVFSVSLSVLGSQFRSSPRFMLVRPVVQSRTDETDYCDLWLEMAVAVGVAHTKDRLYR